VFIISVYVIRLVVLVIYIYYYIYVHIQLIYLISPELRQSGPDAFVKRNFIAERGGRVCNRGRVVC